MLLKLGAAAIALLLLGLPLFAMPATLSLAPGRRPGLEPLTLAQAAERLERTDGPAWARVEAARALVASRMAYSRRNSFDDYPTAFERGYGYCVQQSAALVDLLARLGFEARIVHAFRNRFPDGSVSSHAWVRVRVEGVEHDIDTLFYDPASRKLTFISLSEVQDLTPLVRFLDAWGAPAVNAYRFYQTGKDQDW